jgi:hypothetical protein
MKLNSRDAAAAAALFLTSGAVLLAATGYDYGSARQMGPAYFPSMIAGMGVLVSAALMVSALCKRGERIGVAWRPMFAVLGAVGAFALTLAYLGMGPAIVATVLTAALADRESRPASTVMLALMLTAAAWLIFAVALRLPITMLRADF